MEDIIDVARYISIKFLKKYGFNIDEIRLQKLVYFSQKESMLYTGNILFYSKMKAWKYGPVSIKVRMAYRNRKVFRKRKRLNVFNRYIINNVIEKYSSFSPSKLIELTHKEKAWRKAREGLDKDDRCTKNICIMLIYEENERVYDTYWDMYCDEFEDHIIDKRDDYGGENVYSLISIF
ncbi:Panacea domain-containing protein [Streptobacillus canis]|uniref:Panacea domain-containing protein n=1 Tax=Streptobacillus canis TaxID=2678686 RepID=UPI0012E207C6|nr:type II toxin-antitoxin system antitoxin SocA domain-containing protein [Streptobacillus canis]